MHTPFQTIATPSFLANHFTRLGITAVTYGHPPVFTVEEGQDFKHLIPGGHTKNLFLKDKKGKFWLVTALHDSVINLKALPGVIQAARLSFGNAVDLQRLLGVVPGAVTPLGLIRDTGRQVQPVLDARLFACDTVNCHPLENDKTTSLSPDHLVTWMHDLQYKPLIVDFAAKEIVDLDNVPQGAK